MTPKDCEIEVWDLATRIFHWTLVILVGANLFLIEPRGGLQTVLHFVFGYAIAGLLLFRLAWGFVGSRRSRFADFLHRWPTVKAYALRLLRFDPPHSVGHTPLGGWMIVLLLASLAIMIATGVFAAARRAAGPLAGLLPAWAASLASDLHVLVSDLLIAFVIVHVLGIAIEWLLTGDNLVRTMLTGRKRVPPEAAAGEPPPVSMWRAIPLALLCMALAVWLGVSTDYTRTRATLQQTAGEP